VQGPTVTNLSPNTGVRGSSVPVVFTGTNLGSATGLTGVGTDFTVSNFSATATTVSATLNIANSATLGIHNLGVLTAIGSTNQLPFHVTGATISFSSPNPPLCNGAFQGCSAGSATTTTKNGNVTVTNTASGADASAFTFNAAPTVASAGGTGTFSIGPAVAGQCTSTTVLNPGQSCLIPVRYVPATNDTSLSFGNVTVSGVGLATATQTSTPNFNAN
jgi:hypothetical protein